MIEQYKFVTKDNSIYFPKDWNDLMDKMLAHGSDSVDYGKAIVAVSWKFNDKEIILNVEKAGYPFLLDDKSGVCLLERSDKKNYFQLAVYNGDKTERFRISPPKIIEMDSSEEPYFYQVGYDKKNDLYECVFWVEGVDYIANINMKTGELTNIKTTRY